jgi:type II secretory pathway pseudopilin PulG
MKGFRFHHGRCSARGGFNLVEVCFTIGVLSLAIVTLGPLLGMGLTKSRSARDDRMSAQIARTLTEEAKQGTLGTATVYLDDQGTACSPLNAAFVAQRRKRGLATGPAGHAGGRSRARAGLCRCPARGR